MKQLLLLLLFIPGLFAADRNIVSFGAACNGSDDRTAVQNAINALVNGDNLVIPCLASIGSGGIALSSKSNITIKGTAAGAGFRSLANTSQVSNGHSSTVMFMITACNSCVIQDIVLDLNGTSNSGIALQNSTGSTIQRTESFNIVAPGDGGLISNNNTNNSYLNNIVHDTQNIADGPRGFWFGNTGREEENVLVDGNEAYNIGASGIVVHAHNAQVTNNYSHGNVGSGIKFVPKDINSGLVTVSGNNIDGNAFNGLQIGTRIKCQFEIFDNVFNNTTIGIYVGDGVDAPISITNNYFTNNTSQAIYFYDANDLTIANNRFSENQVSILLHGDPGRVINNVTISTNNIVGSNFIGVQVLGRGGAVTTMAINGNSIVDSSSYGVIIEYTSGTVTGITHSGNCFKNNGTNLLDQRGILSNPASSGSCSDPSTGWGAEPQPPTVSLTTPAAGTVSGIVTVSATAADDVAVVGVQFKLDGVNLQAEDTSAPYSISWDTLGVLNGPHVLTAVARDGSGNSTVSASVNVTVSNIGAPRGLEILNGVKRRGRVEFGPVAVNIIFWSTLTSSQWASLTSSQWATLVP